ncbi:MAG: hypothetical protein IJR14_00020 [Synergistaceae bacterium]|nr:hypothetical protein [Synergistaceae bacterium]
MTKADLNKTDAMDFECSANGRVVRALDEDGARRLLRCGKGCSVLKSGRCSGPGLLGGGPTKKVPPTAPVKEHTDEEIEAAVAKGKAKPEALVSKMKGGPVTKAVPAKADGDVEAESKEAKVAPVQDVKYDRRKVKRLIETARVALYILVKNPYARRRIKPEMLEAIEALREDILSARDAGWGWETIVTTLRRVGVRTSAETLKKRIESKGA